MITWKAGYDYLEWPVQTDRVKHCEIESFLTRCIFYMCKKWCMLLHFTITRVWTSLKVEGSSTVERVGTDASGKTIITYAS